MFLGFCSPQEKEDCRPVCVGCEWGLVWGFPPSGGRASGGLWGCPKLLLRGLSQISGEQLLAIEMRDNRGQPKEVEVGGAGLKSVENKEAKEGGCTIETITPHERALQEQER